MSFYPSLEDMQVDRTLQAQNQQANALNNAIQGNSLKIIEIYSVDDEKKSKNDQKILAPI
jgi:hypothetical protein